MDTTLEKQGSTTLAGSVCLLRQHQPTSGKELRPLSASYSGLAVCAGDASRLFVILFIRLGSILMIKGSFQLLFKQGE